MEGHLQVASQRPQHQSHLVMGRWLQPLLGGRRLVVAELPGGGPAHGGLLPPLEPEGPVLGRQDLGHQLLAVLGPAAAPGVQAEGRGAAGRHRLVHLGRIEFISRIQNSRIQNYLERSEVPGPGRHLDLLLLEGQHDGGTPLPPRPLRTLPAVDTS